MSKYDALSDDAKILAAGMYGLYRELGYPDFGGGVKRWIDAQESLEHFVSSWRNHLNPTSIVEVLGG